MQKLGQFQNMYGKTHWAMPIFISLKSVKLSGDNGFITWIRKISVSLFSHPIPVVAAACTGKETQLSCVSASVRCSALSNEGLSLSDRF